MHMVNFIIKNFCLPLLLIISPSVASAEVMDKEPMLGSIWVWTAVASIVGYLLCRWRVWLVFIAFPLAILLPLGVILELTDPDVGPAIVQEAGASYAVQAYLAGAVLVVAHVSGMVARMRRRRKHSVEARRLDAT